MDEHMKDMLHVLIVVALLVATMVALALFCGCVSENTGSTTTIGEQMALPQITDGSDSIAVNVYESIKGARIWTAKDSKVRITYANSYTNSYFGIVETRDSMALDVEIEPLADAETDVVASGSQR